MEQVKDLLQHQPMLLLRKRLRIQVLIVLIQTDDLIEWKPYGFIMDQFQKSVELGKGIQKLFHVLNWDRVIQVLGEGSILLHVLNLTRQLLNP